MKGGTIRFGTITGLMLLVVGMAIYISGGFQVLWEDFVLIGVAGSIVGFILVIVGLLISVRGQDCSVLVKWHTRLVLDRVNKFSGILYLILSRSS